MLKLSLDNLLSGFIGAVILFLIQNLKDIISSRIKNIRTKWLVKTYLAKLNNDLKEYKECANIISSTMREHAAGGNETKSVSFKGSENVHSHILKSDRYRAHFENKVHKDTVVQYYDLCGLLDLLAIKTPPKYSTDYADLSMNKSSDINKFRNETNRILVKLEACELNAKEAISICEKIQLKFN